MPVTPPHVLSRTADTNGCDFEQVTPTGAGSTSLLEEVPFHVDMGQDRACDRTAEGDC